MSFNNIKTKLRSERGFTIVELLIVIVVIGILAAITIVSFNGVTSKANTTSAQSSAEAVIKKSEAYNAEKGGYPITTSLLTTATQSDSFLLSGVNFTSGPTVVPDSTNGKNTVRFLKCSAGSDTGQSTITATNISGVRVTYYDFSAKSTVNQDTGVTTACPAAV